MPPVNPSSGGGQSEIFTGLEAYGQEIYMFIDEFAWLPDIVEKLAAKHHVSQDEVEEVFFNSPKYRFVESGYTAGEDVYSAGGQTDSGRY